MMPRVNPSTADILRPPTGRDPMNPGEQMLDQGDPSMVYGKGIDAIEKSLGIPPNSSALSDFLDTQPGRTMWHDTGGDPDNFLNAYKTWLTEVMQGQGKQAPDPNYGDWMRDMNTLEWKRSSGA